MPQLPSGRKIAVRPDVIREMVIAPFSHLNEIGKIIHVEDLYPYLLITEFVESDQEASAEIGFVSQSKNTTEVESLQPVDTNIAVADVLDGKAGWLIEDVCAFRDWMDSPDITSLYISVLDEVVKTRDKIRGHVDALAYADIDPDQDEQERFRRASVVVGALKGNSEALH